MGAMFGKVLTVWATAAIRFFLFWERRGEGWEREKNRERGAGWQRERLVCFQLIHFLPDVGSHLSWLETEYKAGILMTVTPHPPTSCSLSTPLSSSPPPFILSTHTLHSVCSTDFLPPVSLPPFYPSHLGSLPMQLHFADPNFPSTPPLLSFYPSLHLTSLYLSRCSVYHLPATLSSSIPPPSCLFFAPCSYQFLFLVSPSAPPLHLACLFRFAFLLSFI